MATELPALSVVITSDVSDLVKSMKLADNKVEILRKSVNQSAASLAKWSVAGAGAASTAAVLLTRNASAAGKEIANLARISGVGAEEFQRFAAGAQTLGIEQDKLGDIFKDVRDRVGDFITTGGGPMVDFFERIAPKVGVTAEQFRKLSGPDALQLFVDSMQKANLSQSEMVFHMEAMAGDAASLLPLLKNNGEEFKRIGDNAAKSGQILSNLDVARLQLAAQEMEAFDRTIATAKNQLGAEFAPILAGIGKLLEDAAKDAGGFGNLIGEAMNTGVDAVGFLLDAFHGLDVTFDVVANAIIAGLVKLGEEGAETALTLLRIADAVPGIDLSSQIEDAERFRREMDAVGDQSIQAIQDKLNEPLPSEGLKKWVADAKNKFDEAARTLKKRLAEAQGGAGLKVQPEADKDSETAFNDSIAEMQEQLITEQKLLQDHLVKMDELEMAHRNGMIESEAEYNALRLQSAQQYMDSLMTINQNGLGGIEGLLLEHNKSTALAMVQGGKSLLGIMATNSKTAFEANKKFALADAAVSMYQGIAAGLKLGWPQSIPAVAYAAANGVKQIQSIRSQQFGGGGSPSVSNNAGGGGTAPAQQQQQQAEPATQNVYLSGDNFSRESLVNLINSAADDGYMLRIAT